MKDWRVRKRERSDLVDQLLLNRDVLDRDSFFNSRYETLADPFLMKDVGKAVRIIKKAKKITVFADYDADGVTSAAIMKSVLPGAKVFIPDRKKDGYGLNDKAVREAASWSDLFLTVDSGITDVAEVELARKLGIKVIITDHHQLPVKLPRAEAIINPQQKDCSYPFKNLCGAGVAFTLARALLKDNPDRAKWLLDLAAIGTIADMVPLRGENRIIAKFGLVVLKKTKRIGLKLLLPAEITSETIAFQVAPRLNAAGRMDHANASYQLLITESDEEAEEIVGGLEKNNQARKKETERVISEIIARIDLRDKLIFAFGGDWPVGVIGLAAGKLMERFYRPAVVISEGIASCRSIEGFDIVKALAKFKDLLLEFGGHPRAAGFRLKEENILPLKEKLVAYANDRLSQKDMRPMIEIDWELEGGDIGWELVEVLQEMEPFGSGNPKPIFLFRAVKAEGIQFVGNGNKHLRFRIKTSNQILKAIYFNAGGLGAHLKDGDYLDLVGSLEKDEWNGYKSIQLNILDLRKAKNKGRQKINKHLIQL